MKTFLLTLMMVSMLHTSAQTVPASNNLKYDFFSPVAGCLGLSLETWFRKGTTMEYTAGFIGIRLEDYFEVDHFTGAYLSIGPKIYFQADRMNGYENYNDFSGYYFKPEVLVNYFSFTDYYHAYQMDPVWIKNADLSANLLLGLGRQWIIREIFTMDLWFAFGYGRNWIFTDESQLPEENYYSGDHAFKFSYLCIGKSPLIFDGGLSVGILLK